MINVLKFSTNPTLFRQLFDEIVINLSVKEKTEYTHPELEEDTIEGLIFLNDNDPMGYVIYYGSEDYGTISYATSSKYRGKKYDIGRYQMGMAQMLLRGICIQLKQMNIKKFSVCVMATNEVSKYCLEKYLNDNSFGVQTTLEYDEQRTSECEWGGIYYWVYLS